MQKISQSFINVWW